MPKMKNFEKKSSRTSQGFRWDFASNSQVIRFQPSPERTKESHPYRACSSWRSRHRRSRSETRRQETWDCQESFKLRGRRRCLRPLISSQPVRAASYWVASSLTREGSDS